MLLYKSFCASTDNLLDGIWCPINPFSLDNCGSPECTYYQIHHRLDFIWYIHVSVEGIKYIYCACSDHRLLLLKIIKGQVASCHWNKIGFKQSCTSHLINKHSKINKRTTKKSLCIFKSKPWSPVLSFYQKEQCVVQQG